MENIAQLSNTEELNFNMIISSTWEEIFWHKARQVVQDILTAPGCHQVTSTRTATNVIPGNCYLRSYMPVEIYLPLREYCISFWSVTLLNNQKFIYDKHGSTTQTPIIKSVRSVGFWRIKKIPYQARLIQLGMYIL